MIKPKGKTQRLFNNNDLVMKRILTAENLVKYYDGEKANKEFDYILNVMDVVEIERVKLVKQELPELKITIANTGVIDVDVVEDVDVKNDIFIKHDENEEIKKLNKSKLNKMKIKELIDLSTQLNITINDKKPIKQTYIDLLLEKISLL